MTLLIEKKKLSVGNYEMAYVDRGDGDPIVFLHGNPTSSFLWRNIISRLEASYRCIAPDLIGMGDSDKLDPSGPERYSFAEHREFLDGFLERLALDRPFVLCVHDWGSALGFDWARRHPARVRGIAYMEAITGMLSFSTFPLQARAQFQSLRSPLGEDLVLVQNVFVEQILPASILRPLTPEELDEYRRPFRQAGESRRPTLSWPRQLPIDGEPQDVCVEVARYAAFLAASPIPKLFINAEPGALSTGENREACRRWPNQREVTVRGLHFIQEDSPGEIATALLDFVRGLA